MFNGNLNQQQPAITQSRFISSSDYALNVIFSQFEQVADSKMSLILNMGVVNPNNNTTTMETNATTL
jgi:hypothetical protein